MVKPKSLVALFWISLISLTPRPMLRRPSAAFTRLGITPPITPAAMPAPVACMNDRRDHLPCRTRLAPSYVMSVSSEVIGLFFGIGAAALPSLLGAAGVLTVLQRRSAANR